jgi:hypothetical protein
VDARLRGVAAPGLFRAEQLRCSSGSGGLRGAALLLAEHGQGQTQPAELLDELQQLAGVGSADELHAA